ncbi:TonB-dependent receptor [Dyella choica]|uniref:TonB-dependent receptor n=1 Tax=Dyella choica TaxID=1927959 RepID=A0A3S0Q238_9GAMM|nr:TonB-dependent receptor [Dyella choica]
MLVLACAGGYGSAFAQDNGATNIDGASKKKLEAITVTGSLIPQTQIETFTPTTTITSEQLKANGFATVAQALQHITFATGSVQNAQNTNSFTPGAKTASFFGLNPGYIKILIDGRSLNNFPALYNSTEVINNLNTIPTDLVERIDFLPGGQSTLYGSDAIAGVINIIMKKKIDTPIVDVRYGWDGLNGGANRHISVANTFKFNKFTLTAGAQLESYQPIWSADRSWTSHYFENGSSSALANRDYLIYNTKVSNSYYMLDPNRCALTRGQFGGTEDLRNRPRQGEYCGSFYSPGTSTLSGDSRTASIYTRSTYDLSETTQWYGDFSYNFDREKWNNGASTLWWGSSSKYTYIYDPDLDDYINLQKSFSPEEVGGYQHAMYKTYERNYTLTLGAKGVLGTSDWEYDISVMHGEDKLVQRPLARFKGAMEDFFAVHVLGPDLGPDPHGNGFSTFRPNYEAFYTPISNSDFNSFAGYLTTRAKTWQNIGRMTLTHSSLAKMPGGDLGVAFLFEAGNEGWDYSPDLRLLTDGVWGQSAVQGAGHRSRFAVANEWRLPLLPELTLSASARFDAYKVASSTVSKPAYSVGLEYRPLGDLLLLRARYGTSFKAPTLADQFTGPSTYYVNTTDYYNCALLGYDPSVATINCPAKYNGVSVKGLQSGNPELRPISATNWSAGFILSPVPRMALAADFYHWNIKDEVAFEDGDKLLLQEAACRLGQLDISSPSCQSAISKITRNAKGELIGIYTPKVNVSNETIDAMNVSFNYVFSMGSFGEFSPSLNYTDILQHKYQPYAGDPYVDLLRSPYWSTDFKTKFSASLNWRLTKWGATLYASRYGRSPNYLVTLNASSPYTKPGEGTLPTWVTFNTSVSYKPLTNLDVSFIVNNLFNAMPPIDRSFPGTSSAPYNKKNYDVYGRMFSVEASYKFGR